MMWLMRGVCVGLTMFGLINALLSIAVPFAAAVARRLSPADLRADVLWLTRLAPGLVSIAVVVTVFLPAYVLFEPHGTDETMTISLAAAAALSVTPLALGLTRLLSSWRATVRLQKRWRHKGEMIELSGWNTPAYRIADAFPVVSVVGIIRPCLFVASQVLERLEDPEVTAVLAHEAAHIESNDNLKALLARSAADWLALFPAGRRLVDEWRYATELAADDRGQEACAATGLDLASALVRVADLVPRGGRLGIPGSALVRGETGGVAGRIGRLLNRRPAKARSMLSRPLRLTSAAVIAIALTALATRPDVFEAVHTLGEQVYRLLS